MMNKSKNSDGIFKSVMIAYSVLVLHVLLIAGLGLLVLFFRGVIQYMIWIFLGGTVAIIVSGYRFYNRMKQEGKTLREMVNSPLFHGRAIEVSILGGMASFKIGKDNNPLALPDTTRNPANLLEDPASSRMRELSELVRLLESNLITLEEFNSVKQQLFQS
ncbi:MAG: SHOCT domain-containing protein [Deltaproteobacteria bacterium]|nr:SHOCT domain-containing protein [Deltaproteobacteria bacterium]